MYTLCRWIATCSARNSRGNVLDSSSGRPTVNRRDGVLRQQLRQLPHTPLFARVSGVLAANSRGPRGEDP